MNIDGSDRDSALSNSEWLTQREVIERRARRVKQLARLYRHHYWALMEDLKSKHREYYWTYGKSPFKEDEPLPPNGTDGIGENGKLGLASATGVGDDIKSMQSGPLLCCKPILRSTVPSLCPTHFQKGEKCLIRDLRKAGLNISSLNNLAPKLHVVVAEFVSQIQSKRRALRKASVAKVEPK
uniref:KAT8 regulatory NSL complex subunit 2 n=1 Tax=Cannabis sativa TaxID=3483 RepID=A0A803PDW1_CANSA